MMTGNEDELQARWAKKGMKSGVVLSTFIFHYRSVSRGDKYKWGRWYRQS
jgi:GT2 family glycosyltransferase